MSIKAQHRQLGGRSCQSTLSTKVQKIVKGLEARVAGEQWNNNLGKLTSVKLFRFEEPEGLTIDTTYLEPEKLLKDRDSSYRDTRGGCLFIKTIYRAPTASKTHRVTWQTVLRRGSAICELRMRWRPPLRTTELHLIAAEKGTCPADASLADNSYSKLAVRRRSQRLDGASVFNIFFPDRFDEGSNSSWNPDQRADSISFGRLPRLTPYMVEMSSSRRAKSFACMGSKRSPSSAGANLEAWTRSLNSVPCGEDR